MTQRRRSGLAPNTSPVPSPCLVPPRSVASRPFADLGPGVRSNLVIAGDEALQGHDAALDVMADGPPSHTEVETRVTGTSILFASALAERPSGRMFGIPKDPMQQPRLQRAVSMDRNYKLLSGLAGVPQRGMTANLMIQVPTGLGERRDQTSAGNVSRKLRHTAIATVHSERALSSGIGSPCFSALSIQD